MARSDAPFLTSLTALGGLYVLMILAMLVAAAVYTTPADIWQQLQRPEVLYSIKLSLLSSAISTILALWVAVPIGYLMSRRQFRGKTLIDAILDIPIVLPPLVIGLFLLIFFQTPIGQAMDDALRATTGAILGRDVGITYDVAAVVCAQFMVACAFAVRTMRVTFEQIPQRYEQVARTLGCNETQAFWRVVFPQCYPGLLSAGTMAWARSLGEFGPILVFAGAMRMKTEVLPTTVYLELTAGNLAGSVAAAMILVALAMIVLITARLLGVQRAAV